MTFREINIDVIPKELQVLPQWVLWRWEERGGRLTKVPYDAKYEDTRAAINDRDSFSTFDTCVRIYHYIGKRHPGGIGFVFTEADPFCGVDFDHCVENGVINDDAKAVITTLDSYSEISPSGTGVKVICKAKLPRGRNRREGIEFYDRGRYFTITGNHIPGTPLVVNDRVEVISELHAAYFPPEQEKIRSLPPTISDYAEKLDDDEVIRRISLSTQGAKFQALMDGISSNYDSPSEADCALAAILAWWCRGDRDQMLRIIQRSALYTRPKWQRADYIQSTLDSGLAGMVEFYGDKRQDSPAAIVNETGPIEGTTRIFLWMSELARQDSTKKWILEGILSRGGCTLLSAIWKAGKTTWLSHLLKAFAEDGTFCGFPIKKSKVLYITEEDQSTWAERRDDLGLGDHIAMIVRPFMGRPNSKQWAEFIDAVSAAVVAQSFDLVVIDTLAKLWPVKDENSSNQVDDALMPLWKILNTGASVLLVHHVRKGGGQETTGIRGSGALPSFVETIIEFNRFNPTDKKCTRRVLTGNGRYRETPAEVVLNLTPIGYVSEGDKEECKQVDIVEVVFEALPGENEAPSSAKDILKFWKPSIPKPKEHELNSVLETGVERGTWKKSGDKYHK